MYFLRVDYVPSSGCGVMRIRSLHASLKDAITALRHVGFDDDKILLVRIELCG